MWSGQVGFGVAADVETGKTYLLAAACAKPCTKVGLMLMTPQQARVGEITWGSAEGDIELDTLSHTAHAKRKLTGAAIAECPESSCRRGASFSMTRAEEGGHAPDDRHYLAVFTSNKTSPKWRACYALSDAERHAKDEVGLAKLAAWDDAHKANIVYAGGPLGLTKSPQRMA